MMESSDMVEPDVKPSVRYNHSAASRALGVDRKTLRKYVRLGMISQGTTKLGQPYYKGEWLSKLYRDYGC